MVENENVSIRDEKVLFRQTLNQTYFTEATRRKIMSFYEKFGNQFIIGRSDIVKVTDDSLTAAGKLINKMKSAELIEPVKGYGKGKYRFRI